MKTAISLDGDLFREARAWPAGMKVSRSRLFAAAMEEFLERRRNQDLLRAINAAYERGVDLRRRRSSALSGGTSGRPCRGSGDPPG